MIKTKGEVRLVQYSDKSWHVEYKRKWLPKLYWLRNVGEWSPFRPNYEGDWLFDEADQQHSFRMAIGSLTKHKGSGEVVMEEKV